MSINTAQAVATLNGLTAKFDARAGATKVFYPELCTVVPSKREGENYGWLGAMPKVREWLGDRVFGQLSAATYALLNKLWEDSIEIEKTKIEDDVLGMFGPAFEMLAEEAMKHPDELLFDLLVGGETGLCYDGQYFFDTDHAHGASGAQSNDLTKTVVSTSAVTVAEFKSAMHAALLAMAAFKNDKGALLNRPTIGEQTDLLCLVPLQLWEVAKTAINALIISDTTNVLLSVPKLVASPYLTTGTKFYLFKNGGVLKPFVFQARRPLSRQMKGLDDHEFKDVKFMCDARYNVGYLAWWNAVLTTFTT